MTHSHPLDLQIVAEALGQQRFCFVGLIGSATKRARFLSQMRAAGLPEEALARLICPLGLPGIEGLDATDDPLYGHQEGRFFHG